ncbi:hypothetical protein [Pseudomonas koreensis]|uniref:DUF1640 domain-containing protein n=1 Tax=Pseudomonas koreensis TaxID=198620 RepID=A0A9X3BBP9_9PSED|nr:hypothetical protein [Pseudomonas koreensis]MCU7247263.1 hypothetical protein [Pseudomonas koreensis]
MKMDLAMYQALISINVPEPKAEAVIKALESDLITLLATKSDLATLRSDVKADLAALRGDAKTDMAALRSDLKSDLSQLELKLSVRMGFMMSTIAGLMFAGIKYLL